MVVLVPDPWNVAPSGCLVSVQLPVPGSPERTRLPVETLHEGWVIVPTTGAPGMSGPCTMLMFADGPEVQPPSLVTV